MKPLTQKLWAKQNQHEGDRRRLFRAVADEVGAKNALYAGSFVDVSASFVFANVTYVDSNKPAAKFFADQSGVEEIIGSQKPRSVANSEFRFLGADYTEDLDLNDDAFDLLVSLYAGFVSEHCTRYLKVGGTLLVNSSHGDVAMAALDERYLLRAVVKKTSADGYLIDSRDLHQYLIPKKSQEITAELLHELGRGIAYTRSPFAYLFQRMQ